MAVCAVHDGLAPNTYVHRLRKCRKMLQRNIAIDTATMRWRRQPDWIM
jgi:hypothetical protein